MIFVHLYRYELSFAKLRPIKLSPVISHPEYLNIADQPLRSQTKQYFTITCLCVKWQLFVNVSVEY